MATTVVNHPLAATRLSVLRAAATTMTSFRLALSELTAFLLYEATRSLPTVAINIHTPLAPSAGRTVEHSPVLIPVLRAGLGMLPAAMALLPTSEVGMVGLRRDETTLRPDPYLTKLPEMGQRPALVLDPMLATGGSLIHTLAVLVEAGASSLTVCCVLAAPEGLAAIAAAGFGKISIFTAAIDSHLDHNGFIVPGLGDAGDRLFG